MASNEQIESFLIELEMPFERLDDGIWVIVNEADHGENLVVYRADSVLSLRVKLFELPTGDEKGLFRRLLELNASAMVHGAFGVEDDAVVITGSLELDNLDLNELQAMIDSFGIAISSHHEELSALLEATS